MVMTTAEFAAFLKAEGPKWQDAVREAGIVAKE
jgi:tripartite-type tricarboxylate transporter receptor subunit TctC